MGGVGRALEPARVAQFQRKTPAMKSFLVCSARPFVLVGPPAHFLKANLVIPQYARWRGISDRASAQLAGPD
jgi:hypothetical protein